MKKLIAQATFLTLLLAVAAPVFANGPCCCTPFTETIVSDETNTVVGDGNAVAVAPVAVWTAVVPGATWIWKSGPTADNETVAFEKSFTVTGTTVLSAVLDIASDNSYAAFIDGVPVASDASATNFTLATQDSHNLLAFVTTGVHTLRIEVKNNGTFDPLINPAGLLYTFVVESETCVVGDIKVKVRNGSTTVVNVVGTSASSGWSAADGGSASAKVKKSGNVTGSGNDDNTTSAGGNSSTGGSGGAVVTGSATATSKVTSNVNGTVIRVRRL